MQIPRQSLPFFCSSQLPGFLPFGILDMPALDQAILTANLASYFLLFFIFPKFIIATDEQPLLLQDLIWSFITV